MKFAPASFFSSAPACLPDESYISSDSKDIRNSLSLILSQHAFSVSRFLNCVLSRYLIKSKQYLAFYNFDIARCWDKTPFDSTSQEGQYMKLAVISDLHGNYYALAKVLAFLRSQEIDGIIGLGDFVTDGPFPQRMMELLREMQDEFPCYLVRGNREEYLLENLRHPQSWKAGSSTSGLLDYTFRNLTGQDLEFFEQLPTDGVLIGKMHESGRLIPVFVPQEEITPDTCRESLFPALRLCHGAPGELRGNFGLHPELLLSHLENLDAAILLGGHSHKQEQREYAGKTYLNPGSLGLALDGVGGHAHFAILTLENNTWQIECFQVPYDLEGYLAEFDRAGLETHGSVLARSLKRTLTCGVNYFYLTVKRVRELADALALTDLDEELWEKAERELK